MTRRYQPDGEHLAAALAGRLDVLEADLRQTAGDVTALGRALADLTGQIRHNTTTGQPANVTSSSSGTSSSSTTSSGSSNEEAEQVDWFGITDPTTAVQILAALIEWHEHVLAHHGLDLPVQCWPLHPAVVVDLIALAAERNTAYDSPDPTPVSEWLTRWLPAAAERITTTLGGCAAERGHRHEGCTYDVRGFDPLSAATWWALDRDTPAPEAFALTPIN